MVFEGIPITAFVQTYFLPFMIFFVIIWGVLSAIKVFGRSINLVLALAISVLALMTPQFAIFSQYMSQISGFMAIGAFAAVFVFGVAVWSFGKGRDIYEEHGAPSMRLERLIKRRDEYMKKAAKADDQGKRNQYRDWMKKAHEIEDDIHTVSSRK
jgi:hypothetical protein